MKEYLLNISKSYANRKAAPEPETKQAFDWKQQKERWKQIIDHYHKGTRRIPSPQ